MPAGPAEQEPEEVGTARAGGPARNQGAGTRPEAGRLGGSELGPLGGRRSQLVLQPEAH